METLPHRQKRFLELLLIGGQAPGRCYEQAGYKARGTVADVAASRLLKNVNFRPVYLEKMTEAANEALINKARILLEEGRIAFSDIGEIFSEKESHLSPADLPESIRRAVSSVEIIKRTIKGKRKGDPDEVEVRYKYKLWNKSASLERLEKHLGFFKDHEEAGSTKIIVVKNDDK